MANPSSTSFWSLLEDLRLLVTKVGAVSVVHLLAEEDAAKKENQTQKIHSKACDMEVNQGPSRLWYELLALQLMQFPGM